MSFLMTLTSAERDAVLAMRQKSGKHVFFDETGEPIGQKKKRTLSEEHKAKLLAAAALARAKKAGEKARLAAEDKAELRALVDASDRGQLVREKAAEAAPPAPSAEPVVIRCAECHKGVDSGYDHRNCSFFGKGGAGYENDDEWLEAAKTYTASLTAPPVLLPPPVPCLAPAPAAEKPKPSRTELPADATPEQKELWGKTNQELRDIYHPLVGKKVGMRTSGPKDKLALVMAITELRAAGHTPENPKVAGKAKAE